MNILNTINAIIVIIGIPTIISTILYIGKKLQIIEDLKPIRERFTVIESKVDDLAPIRERFVVVESRVNDLWKDRIAPARSPRQLNERGDLILKKSGIKEIIDNKKNVLFEIVKEKNTTNPYDAEAIILSIVTDLPSHCPDVVEQLKTGAFNSGASINDVLFVGSIYLRNLIFPKLGFKIEELDNPKI